MKRAMLIAAWVLVAQSMAMAASAKQAATQPATRPIRNVMDIWLAVPEGYAMARFLVGADIERRKDAMEKVLKDRRVELCAEIVRPLTQNADGSTRGTFAGAVIRESLRETGKKYVKGEILLIVADFPQPPKVKTIWGGEVVLSGTTTGANCYR